MYLPAIKANVPGRSRGLISRLARFTFHRSGWTFEGEIPDISKFVLIGAPHTSNWDFVLAMTSIIGLEVDVRWIGKHTIFRWPFGGLMRWLGGTPVNRNRPGGIVGQVLEEFQSRDRFIVAIAPEGTRRKVERWKTGFHRIARLANVPVVPAYLDFGRKVVGFGGPVTLGDDPQADIEGFVAFYSRYRGKNPLQF